MNVVKEIVDPEILSLVVGLLEGSLGKGIPDRKSNYAFMCPFCNHRKPKLTVNVKTGEYNCWTCEPKMKGTSPHTLLKRLGASSSDIKEMKGYYGYKVTVSDDQTPITRVSLPKEFQPLDYNTKSLSHLKAVIYAKSRGISELDALKYNIGFCETGKYRNRLIVPTYDSNNKLTYFVARSILDKDPKPFDAPTCDKSKIIGFENLINWNVPIILCEGPFDAIAIKRNSIPLFGKSISEALMKKLVESNVKTVYIALDNDAIERSMAYTEELISYGKEVYQISVEDKDPSKLGFNKMIELLQSAKPLGIGELFLNKMKMIIAKA